MVGRCLLSEEEAVRRGWGRSDCARRREVLRETIAAFLQANPPERFHELAKRNLERWRQRSSATEAGGRVDVYAGDWGEVTRSLTVTHGMCFDCHFRIGEDQYDSTGDRYHPQMTKLLSAEDGAVYLDVEQPRVCIRGPEDRSRADLGYDWLLEDEVFPFFELRAAAQDLRDGSEFDPSDARRRVAAQLDTLRDRGIRHVVLGAFGCGAFRNPADRVASIYRDEIAARATDFAVTAFAIFSAGYGPDNFTPFASAMGE